MNRLDKKQYRILGEKKAQALENTDIDLGSLNPGKERSILHTDALCT